MGVDGYCKEDVQKMSWGWFWEGGTEEIVSGRRWINCEVDRGVAILGNQTSSYTSFLGGT